MGIRGEAPSFPLPFGDDSDQEEESGDAQTQMPYIDETENYTFTDTRDFYENEEGLGLIGNPDNKVYQALLRSNPLGNVSLDSKILDIVQEQRKVAKVPECYSMSLPILLGVDDKRGVISWSRQIPRYRKIPDRELFVKGREMQVGHVGHLVLTNPENEKFVIELAAFPYCGSKENIKGRWMPRLVLQSKNKKHTVYIMKTEYAEKIADLEKNPSNNNSNVLFNLFDEIVEEVREIKRKSLVSIEEKKGSLPVEIEIAEKEWMNTPFL